MPDMKPAPVHSGAIRAPIHHQFIIGVLSVAVAKLAVMPECGLGVGAFRVANLAGTLR